MGGKCDLIARRGGLVVDDVEHTIRLPFEGCLDRLRDVVNVDTVRHMARLGDAMSRSAQKPDHPVLSRTIVAVLPQYPHGEHPPRTGSEPSELRFDTLATTPGLRSTDRRPLV